MKLITPPASLAVGCLALLAPAVFAQNPVYPGTLRGHLVADSGVGARSYSQIVVGDYSGDYRTDAAMVVDGGLSFVVGVAGFGFTVHAPAPSGGTTIDCIHYPAQGTSTESVLMAVKGGSAPGLYEMRVGASGAVTILDRPVAQFDTVLDLELLSSSGGNEIIALDQNRRTIVRAKDGATGFQLRPGFNLGASVDTLELGNWGPNSDTHVFCSAGKNIYVYALDGTLMATLTTVDSVYDFDIQDDVNGATRVAIVTANASTGLSAFELHHENGNLEGPQSLGVFKPRISNGDMAGLGQSDLVAMCTSTEIGFISFAGSGLFGNTYDFESLTSVWSFPSPLYGPSNHNSNIIVADMDYDGDLDILNSDEAVGALWVQPNTASSEIDSAPVLHNTLETFAPPGTLPSQDQALGFFFSAPLNAGFTATHFQVTVYQAIGVAGSLEYEFRGSATALLPNPSGNTYSVSNLLAIDDSQFEGPDATTASLVCTLRFLKADASTDSFGEVGTESYFSVAFERDWISDTALSTGGYYVQHVVGGPNSGVAGGVNPLPTTRGGDDGVICTPPPAPTPPAPDPGGGS